MHVQVENSYVGLYAAQERPNWTESSEYVQTSASIHISATQLAVHSCEHFEN